MEEIARLKKEIEDNKRKIVALEKNQKEQSIKVPKKEIDKFAKLYNSFDTSPYIKYYRFVIYTEMNGIGEDMDEEITTWFGEDIPELEKARQFVIAIKPNFDKFFINAIEYIRKSEEEN